MLQSGRFFSECSAQGLLADYSTAERTPKQTVFLRSPSGRHVGSRVRDPASQTSELNDITRTRTLLEYIISIRIILLLNLSFLTSARNIFRFDLLRCALLPRSANTLFDYPKPSKVSKNC